MGMKMGPGNQLLPDWDFCDAMYDHIASEMIALISQYQASFEPGEPLKYPYAGICVRTMQRILNKKISKGITPEIIKKRSRYFLKITGDAFFEAHPLVPDLKMAGIEPKRGEPQ